MDFSSKMDDLPEAVSIHINEIVYDATRKGRDITVLSLGEAFFDIPSFSFKDLDFVRGYHYSDSRGIPELRRCIAGYYADYYDAKCDWRSEVLVSAGSKAIIYMILLALVDPGDEVYIQEPGWLSYEAQIELTGAHSRFVRYDQDLATLDQVFGERARVFILNNPNNPAGRLYSGEELRHILEVCRARGITLLVDEAYSDFVVDGFTSMVKVQPDFDGFVVVNSLSKNMGMSGWRIGYMLAHAELVERVLKINQHLLTCAPTILQIYLASYFDQVLSVTLPQVREIVAKRARIAERMADLGLRVLPGASTFYFFVYIDDFPGSDYDLAMYLLFFHQVSVVPGSAYGASVGRFVRVGIGAESEERIEQALLFLRSAISMKDFDLDALRERMRHDGYEYGVY